MAVLGQLKMTNTERGAMRDPIVQRRQRLIDKLAEQRQIAEALLDQKPVNLTRLVYETDEETGERKQVQRQKRVRQWFWHNLSGAWFMEVRYGNKVIEFAKDKKAVEIGGKEQIIPTIDTLIEAVKAGELDKPIEAVSKRPKDH